MRGGVDDLEGAAGHEPADPGAAPPPFVPSAVEAPPSMRALLVDPSLFTAPYDAALSRGLAVAGVETQWAARRLRAFEEPELDPARVSPIFYPLTERGRPRTAAPWRLMKGVEHAAGLMRLVRLARRFDVVHFQWAMLPLLDARAIRAIARERPVIVTVHDTQPFNGKAMSALRTAGTRGVLDAAARVVVHTAGARDALVAAGLAPAKIAVIPHGLLPVKRACGAEAARSGRWRVLLFGRMQSYKGIDVLVEALGLLPPADRDRLELVVAGADVIDLTPLRARAAALGLDEAVLRFEPRHFGGEEMAACLASADAFVLPYRAIEASGVLFMVAGFNRWIVASDIGAFRDLIGTDGAAGELVPPGDAQALAAALVRSVGRMPSADAAARAADWPAIGAATRAVYESALEAR